ncbi:hypothetical protein CO705_14930 [Ralstonia pickettii]|nr:hypothetical protein CO705_14930 [Ralstonia pickettii]
MATRFQIPRNRSDQPAWVDDFPDNALEHLLGALPDDEVHALIDNAFDTGFALRMHARFSDLQPQSLYAGRYDGPGLTEIAPSVLRIPDEVSRRREFLEFALRETSGKPMLSFLHCTASTHSPLLHLRNQMEAVDHEGTAFVVRFADTRALDMLLRVFDDAQRERFLGTMRWWYFRRDGALQEVSHAGAGDQTDAPYVFSQEQMERFDALARPDGMLRLVQTSEHWLGPLVGEPSKVHACIRAALDSSGVDAQAHDASVLRLVAGALTEAGLLQSQHHDTTEQP